MVINACSFLVNFPGFMSKVNLPRGTLHRGSFSHILPIGKTRSLSNQSQYCKLEMPRNNDKTIYPIRGMGSFGLTGQPHIQVREMARKCQHEQTPSHHTITMLETYIT
jgi:hypothetical protein